MSEVGINDGGAAGQPAAGAEVITGGADDDAAAAAAAATAADGSGAASWRDALPDDLKADATLAKYDNVEALARSNVELKKALGADKILLPKGDDDEAGWNGLYQAIGRPEKAEDYKFRSLAEGETSPFADAMRPILHANGGSQKLAAALDDGFQDFMSARAEAARAAASAAMDKLAGEMTITREQLDTRIGDICTKTRMSEEAAAGLVRGTGGNEAAARWLLGLADSIGEGRFVDGGNAENGLSGRDPDEVRAELTKDSDFRTKLLAGDAEANRRWSHVQAAVAAKRTGKKNPLTGSPT